MLAGDFEICGRKVYFRELMKSWTRYAQSQDVSLAEETWHSVLQSAQAITKKYLQKI